ncbi:MAG: oligosaccharide flippase family protein [Candidatus Bathyarchaeota archaeon]|nr:oligosaccharide flippase family protein [Candidatus Bathyarchaeota archaeon]
MVDKLTRITEDLARSGFFMFSGTFLSSVILAISVVLVGRFLGPELYGQYSLVTVIPGLLLLFTDLGIKAGITKFVAAFHSEGKDATAALMISHGLLFRLGLGFAFSVFSIFFANYFALLINRPDLTFLVQIASVSLVFQIICNTLNSAFVGLDRSEYYALVSNTQSILRTILQVTLVIMGFGVTGALIGYIGGFIVTSIFAVMLLYFTFLKDTFNSESGSLKVSYSSSFRLLAHYGMPIYVSVVLVGFFPLYQQLILAHFASDTLIGNFRAAYNFAMLLTLILTAISTALLPAFSKLEASPKLVNAFFKRANKYTSLVMIPITTLVILFSEPIVQLLYGSDYTSAPLFLSLNCSLFFSCWYRLSYFNKCV